MEHNSKHYFIETDIIEIAGRDAIKIIGERGNNIYIDFHKVEQRADDVKNPKRAQYQEALDYIFEGKIHAKQKEIELASGGSIFWNYEDLSLEEKRKIHVITKQRGLISTLKRKGISCEFPEFLRYVSDIFDQGMLELKFMGNMYNLTLDILEHYYPETLFLNNQLIRINSSDKLIFQVKYPLEQIHHHRWKIETDAKAELIDVSQKGVVKAFKGFTPRNFEQKIGFELLRDSNIELHIITGGSGSGKTVMAYAAAMDLLLSKPSKEHKRGSFEYEGIVLFKSNDIIGGDARDEGFLPGTAFEKAKPYLQSYIDAHRLLGLDNPAKEGISFENLLADPFSERDEFGKRTQSKVIGRYLPSNGRAIEIAHLRFARGRTFEKRLILVDEAQNYSPFEIKQLLERVGEGSKIFLIGDPQQVDNPQLDPEFNGLVYAAHTFYNSHPRFSITKLDKNYRSQTAELMREKKAPKV